MVVVARYDAAPVLYKEYSKLIGGGRRLLTEGHREVATSTLAARTVTNSARQGCCRTPQLELLPQLLRCRHAQLRSARNLEIEWACHQPSWPRVLPSCARNIIGRPAACNPKSVQVIDFKARDQFQL